ncbi:MAG TPA: DUF2278 family protein [Terriglobia bacterium]|nr:DUF2278 family protein [Terriglobia bacterium]
MLTDGYRILAGTLASHHRDPPDNVGRWFHVHLSVSAQGHNYDCAIDVDSHQSNTGVEWRVITLRPQEWSSITGLPPGLHALANNATSGALDYIRDKRLVPSLGCVFVMMPDAVARLLMALAQAAAQSWQRGDHIAATTALEGILEVGRPVYIFGEPFHTGLGLHNIHQNQGDPLGTSWANENGIWQDGGTIIQRSSGSLVAFISKFTTQSYKTDNQGHPSP